MYPIFKIERYLTKNPSHCPKPPKEKEQQHLLLLLKNRL